MFKRGFPLNERMNINECKTQWIQDRNGKITSAATFQSATSNIFIAVVVTPFPVFFTTAIQSMTCSGKTTADKIDMYHTAVLAAIYDSQKRTFSPLAPTSK